MNILYVGPVPPLRGGIAQHGARVAAALRQAGNDVSVVTWGAQYPGLLYKGVQRESGADFPASVDPMLKWYSPLSWWRARRLAARNDLVVVQWVHPFHTFPLRVILGGAKDKSVVIVHNARPHERFPFADLATRVALRPASRIIAHANDVADAIANILERSDVVVTPHPPNLTSDRVDPPPGPPWRLLFAGFVRHYKGADIAIEATAELRRKGLDVTLTVAGSFWEDVEDYEALAASLGVDDIVTLRDEYLDDSTLVEMLDKHHVLVAPYRSATQSGLIPMALAAGRPVAATAVGGLPEQIPEGAGTIAVPDDPAAFADAIEALLDRFDSACASAAAQAPTWTATADAIVGGLGS